MAKKSIRELLRAHPVDGLVSLADVDPGDRLGVGGKKAKRGPDKHGEQLLDLQERLYAERKRSILIVLQGLDTSGKDGTVRHVFRHMNPQGVHVRSFKAPTADERRHHFLWRYKKEIPAAGHVTIFNRSHYEDVLVARVKSLATPAVIESRYDQINRFEAGLAEAHVTLIKICLHISYDEQRRRLVERLTDPEKRWKFSQNDIKERGRWGAYTEAFDIALTRCSTRVAPWYIVPADDKDVRNWAISKLLLEILKDMDPQVPRPRLPVSRLLRQLAE